MRAGIAAILILAAGATSAAWAQLPPDPLQARIGTTVPLVLEPDGVVITDQTTAPAINDFPTGVVTFLPRKTPAEMEEMVAAERARNPRIAADSAYLKSPMMTVEAYITSFMPRMRTRGGGGPADGVVDLTMAISPAGGGPLTPVDRRVGCPPSCTVGEIATVDGQPLAYVMAVDRSAAQASISTVMVVGDTPLMIKDLRVNPGQNAVVTLPDGRTLSLAATVRAPTQTELTRSPGYPPNLVGQVSLTSAQ